MKIEIDDEVWIYLKNHAEPLEDTPNSVLRRLLLGRNLPVISPSSTIRSDEVPKFPSNIPMALQQILEVIYLVKCKNIDRSEATHKVAKDRKIAPQTVIDKYCRQLNKRATEIDNLLKYDMDKFKSILLSTFSIHKIYISDFFKKYLLQ